jgi:hypothetical protein
MPRAPKKAPATPKVRSSSKALKTPAKVESPAEVVVTVYDMAFTEEDPIMAKWPGTNLYFKAKVTFVRDEDNEYDVQVCNCIFGPLPK